MANKTKLEINIVSPKDNESTAPKDQEPVSPKPDEENNKPADPGQAVNPSDHKEGTENRPTESPTETEEGIIAEAPNTGFNLPNLGAYTTKAYIISGFFLVLIAAIIVYKLTHKVKQKNKKDRVSLKVKHNKLTKILPIISFLFLGLLLSLDSFATNNNLRINVYPSRNVSFKADIVDTNDIKYVHDEILIPSTSFGYKVSIFTDNDTAELVNKEDSSLTISSIKTPGKLSDNEFGYTLEEPTKDTIWYPIGTNSSHTEIFNQSGSVEAQTIDIWYGVKASDQQSGTYTINLDFIGTTNEVIFNMQNMDSSVCNALIESETYRFKDTRDGKEYNVSKLKDGNCWMTENLATELVIEDGIVGTEKDGVFTKFDDKNTDLQNSEWQTTQDTFLPSVYDENVEGSEDEEWTVDYMEQGYEEALSKARSVKVNDDVYYNYAAAKAGDLDFFTIPDDAVVEEEEFYNEETHNYEKADAYIYSAGASSICPKGWTLPNYTQYYGLGFIYGFEAYDTDDFWTLSSPANFSLSPSNIEKGREVMLADSWGEDVNYLSSDIIRVHDEFRGMYLNLGHYHEKGEEYYFYPSDDTYGYGSPARCIAKPDKVTVIYDENTDEKVDAFPARIAEFSADEEIVVDETAPSREGYVFQGYATSENGQPTYNIGDKINTANMTVILYAIWAKEVPNTTTLQDFDQTTCVNLEANERYLLEDKRDGKTYVISRLDDGNCWMMENLDLDLSPEAPLTPELSDVEETWTPDRATSTNPEEEWYETMDDLKEARSFDVGQKSVGNHYNLMAASAGSAKIEFPEGASLDRILDGKEDPEITIGTSSICPKNWHLPKYRNYTSALTSLGFILDEDSDSIEGYNGNLSLSEAIDALNRFVSGWNGIYDMEGYYQLNDEGDYYASTMFTNDTVEWEKFSDEGFDLDKISIFNGAGVRCIASYTDAELNYLPNGDEVSGLPETAKQTVENQTTFFKISDIVPTRKGYVFAGWSKTTDRKGELYFAGDSIEIEKPTTTLYATWIKELKLEINGKEEVVSTLQQLGSLAANDPEDNLCSALEEEVVYGLKDSRDNKVYKISRLKDGRCWMVQNLALGGKEALGLNSTDTALNDGEAFTLPASSGASENWANDESCERLSTQGNCNTPHMYKEAGRYYYNWTAAIAMNDSGSLTGSETATTSICPKGWHLPFGGKDENGNDDTNSEFRALIDSYNSEDELAAHFLDGSLAGYKYYSSINSNGYYEYYLGSTLHEEWGYSYPIVLRNSKKDDLYVTSADRYGGYSIRCVLDRHYDYTINFEPNVDGDAVSGMPANETKTLPQSSTKYAIPNTEPTRSGYIFAGWSKTPERNNHILYKGDKINMAASDEITLYATWLTPAPFTTMQVLGEHPEYCATLELEKPYGIRDARDGKVYKIARLSGGWHGTEINCWMIQNLALGGDQEIVLDYKTTNIRDNSEIFVLPASNWERPYSGNDFLQRVYDDGGEKYYNRFAAKPYSGYDDADICPNGWGIPITGIGNHVEDSFYMTFDNSWYGGYGLINNGQNNLETLLADPFSFTLTGEYHHDTRTVEGVGEYGKLWGATYNSSKFGITNSGQFSWWSDYDSELEKETRGYSIRCVLYGNKFVYDNTYHSSSSTSISESSAVSNSPDTTSTSSAPASVESNTSSPSTAYNYRYNNNYDHYGEATDTSEPKEEEDKDDSTEKPSEKVKDRSLEDDKTAPLGVVKQTEKQEEFDPVPIIVISASVLLVLLGITAIVVIEKRNND